MKNQPLNQPDVSHSRTFQEILDRFEQTWNSDSRPSIEQFVTQPTTEPEKEKLLIHLIQLDVELRRRAGENPVLHEYSKRFPDIDTQLLDDLLQLPAPPPPSMAEPRLPARYRVIRQIGKGGIGSVWRIHDTQMDRPLAAKVLLSKFQFNSSANRRLDREALLTGSLQHPGVPPVHERGQLASGASFFTMKLVDGQTLAEILKNRSSVDQDRSSLLGIFEQIAQTMAFAHSEGIIHRDLKPQNVMVGRFGEVQIMDWGMAKRLAEDVQFEQATEDSVSPKEGPANFTSLDTAVSSDDPSVSDRVSSLTQQGDVFGTPAYMPPEQARGDQNALSERSDVFGLGAILFEILTGTRLYDDVSDRELMQRVANCEYEKSIELLQTAGLDEELVRICQQCIQKSQADRPRSAQDVAVAVFQYMSSVENRVKQAEMDRNAAEIKVVAERKRRRTVLGLASVIITVALTGLFGVAWQWNSAVQSGALAQSESRRAQANFEKLLDAVERMLTRVGDEKLDQLPYMKTVRRELLQDALLFYQQILDQEGDSPRLVLEVAEANRLVGKIHYLLGENPESIQHNREAIRLFLSLDGLLPQRDVDRPLAYCLESLARIEKRLGNLPEAEKMYAEAVQIRSDLTNAFPNDPILVINLSDSLRGLGNTRRIRGNLEGATNVIDEAINNLNQVVAADVENTEGWLALAACYHEYASLEFKRGKLESSVSYDQQAVDVLDPLVRANDGANEEIKAELSRYLNNLASTQQSTEQFEEAESNHLRVIELRKQLVRDFPNTPEYRSLLAGAYTNLGVVYKLTDRPDEARVNYDSAIELLSDLSLEFPNIPEYRSGLGITLHNSANFLEATERNEKAVELRLQAVDVVKKLAEDFSSRPSYQRMLGLVYNDLALQLERRGRTPEAVQAATRTIEVRRDLVDRFADNKSYQMALASSRGLKGWILAMAPDPAHRDPKTSLELAQTAIAVSPDDPGNCRSLGAALYRNGRFDESIDALMRTNPSETKDPPTFYLLAMAHSKTGNQAVANDWFSQAQELASALTEKPDINLKPIQAEALDLLGVEPR